jgi:hypothetical protein
MNHRMSYLAGLVAAGLLLGADVCLAHDRDDNPPGPRGGPGTNWENPPGPRGGPGASPDRWWQPMHHRHVHWQDRDDNPPGPRGGPGASPNRNGW